MIYAGSPALDDLGLVVLDEVHFLQDTYRGPVWEEVIIHLPAARAAGLPVGDGEQHRRAGRVDPDRPRPDDAGRRAAPAGAPRRPLPRRRPHQRPAALAGDVRRRAGRTPTPCASTPRRSAAAGRPRHERPARGQRPAGARTRRGASRRSSCSSSAGCCRRSYFIFSRNQCDEAARSCLAAGLRLTTGDERDRIREIVDARLEGLGRRRPRRARLRAVPRPARGRHRRPPRRHGAGVQGGGRGVLRRGADQGRVRHRDAGRRHQHAGPHGGHREADEVHRRPPRDADGGGVHPADRAGRAAGHRRRRATPSCCGARSCRSSRSPRSPPAARSTSARRSARRTTWPPTSSARTPASRPTTCSTCRSRSTRPTATSCASRPGSSGCGPTSAAAREQAESPYGDIWDYRRSLDEIRARRRGPRRPGRRSAWPGCGPARSSTPPRAGTADPVAVVASAHRKGGMRLTTVTKRGRPAAADRRRLRRRAPRRRHDPPADGVQPEPRRVPPRGRPAARAAPSCAAGDAVERPARSSDGPHAVESDPELRQRMRAAGQAERLERELVELSGRVEGHNQSLGPRVRPRARRPRPPRATSTPGAWALTDARRGAGPGVPRVRPARRRVPAATACSTASTRPTLAGLLSVFVYEHRSPEPAPPPWFPSADARDRWRRIVAMSEDLAADERSTGLGRAPPARPRLRRRRLRLGRRRGPRRGRRRRGAHRRRLRAHDEAARSTWPARSALVAPDAPTRAARRAGGRRAAFRGVVADGVVGAAGRRRRAGRRMTIRPGRDVGRGGARARRTCVDVSTRRRRWPRTLDARRPPAGPRCVGGDLLRTLGGPSTAATGAARFPIDVLRVEADGRQLRRRRPRRRPRPAVAVVARARSSR